MRSTSVSRTRPRPSNHNTESKNLSKKKLQANHLLFNEFRAEVVPGFVCHDVQTTHTLTSAEFVVSLAPTIQSNPVLLFFLFVHIHYFSALLKLLPFRGWRTAAEMGVTYIIHNAFIHPRRLLFISPWAFLPPCATLFCVCPLEQIYTCESSS